jgi:transcriptional regulator with XRE-family HTH domain
MPKQHPRRQHLRAWRNFYGKTLQEVADALGVAHSTVQRQEAGGAGVDDTTFAAIARFYGITPAELEASPADAGKARALHKLYTLAKGMDAEGLAALATMAERMKPKP